MEKLYDEDGNEVEDAITSEELETKQQEAVDKYKEENPDKSEEIETLKTQIEDKEEENEFAKKELEKLGKKDFNFSKLRDKNKVQETELEKLKGEMNEKLDGILNKVNEKEKDKVINELAEGDEELKKKINFHFDNFKSEANSEEDVKERIDNAYILATGGQKKAKGNFVSSAGAGNSSVAKSKATPEAKEMGKEMGITEEDYKKAEKK